MKTAKILLRLCFAHFSVPQVRKNGLIEPRDEFLPFSLAIIIEMSSNSDGSWTLFDGANNGWHVDLTALNGALTAPGAITAQDFIIGTSTSGNHSIFPTIVYDGDSLTSGVNGTHPYNFYITPPSLNGISFNSYNIGVGGQLLYTMYGQAYANLNPLYAINGGMNVLVLWGGTNDIANAGLTAAQTEAYLAQFAQHERQLGWKVIVLTMISRASLDSDKNSYNALIRANWPQFADGLADVAANPNLGADGAYANTTYFSSDQVHLTDTGYQLVASIVQPVITQVITAASNSLVQRGNVGIGTTSPFALLSVSNNAGTTGATPLFAIASTTGGTATSTVLVVDNVGDLTVTTPTATCTLGNSTGSVTCSSDARLKTNITEIPDALAKLEQIKGVTFNWADPAKSQATYMGVIAEDVEKVFPEAVVTEASGYLAVDYGMLVAPLIEAVKEIASISGEFKTNLIAWLGDAGNGIGDLYANTTHQNTLCLGSTCVTESQLKTMLQNSGQQAAPPPVSGGGGGGSSSAAASTDDSATTTSGTSDTATSTDSTSTSDTAITSATTTSSDTAPADASTSTDAAAAPAAAGAAAAGDGTSTDATGGTPAGGV